MVSRTVTVNEVAVPAVADAILVTEYNAATGGVASLDTMPVMDGVTMSVAVIVCLPTVKNFTLTVAMPLTSATLAGNMAAESELVK